MGMIFFRNNLVGLYGKTPWQIHLAKMESEYKTRGSLSNSGY
jgi:hypothetical protein